MNAVKHVTSLQQARHLIHRTGFAEKPAVVQAVSQTPLSTVVDALLNNPAPVSPLPPPSWALQPVPPRPDMRDMDDEEKRLARKAIRARQNARIRELRIWWLSNLVVTDNPLAARMTLFWQNHFTTAYRKVRHPPLLYRQQAIFIEHATGKFGDILRKILQDPAMLIYLDNRVNRRNRPNENLARELLELFALGEGNYQEQDIRELARALTGLSTDKHLDFRFKPKFHDAKEKSLFGRRGNLALNDVIELLLAHPATAEHLTRKLWRHFISDTPDDSLVAQWANIYRALDYDTRPLLHLMFTSQAFSDPANQGQLIKSPVEFIAGLHRVLGISPIDGKSLMRASQAMQQNLYNPPNVQGWVGGAQWINTETLLARRRFINQLLRGDDVSLEGLAVGMSENELFDSLVPFRIDDVGSVHSKKHPIEQALRSPTFNLS